MNTLLPLVAVLSLTQQNPPPVPLTGKTQRLAQAFSSIDALAELPDGRLVLVDGKDRTVWLGDLASGRVTQVSRRGSGPLEYQQPGAAFALRDGNVVVADPGNARFLKLSADGRVLGTWRPVNGAGREQELANLAVVWDARAIDAQGRLYYEVLPPPLEPGHSAMVPIIRYDFDNARSDTVARSSLAAEMFSLVRTPGPPGTAIIRRRAWPARPEWAVAPSGSVAIVRPSPYSVSFVEGTARRDGPAIPVQSMNVTEADRLAVTEAMRRAPRGPSSPNSEPPRPANAPPPTRKNAGAPVFPDLLPPFSGRQSVRAGPDGRIWVTRLGHVTDSIQVVDVFGVDGRIAQRVLLPPRRHILALTTAYIYLVYRDPDDLEYVERVARR